MSNITDRFKKAWSVFTGRDPTYTKDLGMSYGYRPDRMHFTRGHDRSIVNSIYSRISVDCASISIKHVVLDDNGGVIDTVKSGLNECFNLSANIDQTGRAFSQDIVASMLDEGVVAIVPTLTDDSLDASDSMGICEMRTGKILQWYPKHIKVRIYNERTGKKEDIIIKKDYVAIVENPFYSIMNEPNSTLQRLIEKLNLLDYVDKQSSSGKLDMIIQLPYVIKSEAQKKQAEERRKSIEMQLTGSKYGIAYTDGTEHITQLNRPIENNLLKQVEDLTNKLFAELGLTTTIMDQTADEKVMNNYYNRVIEPIMSAITDEMKRKFLTATARTQGKSIVFFRDPFKLIPVSDLAEISDKLTRNEIMSSNEIRQKIGLKPSNDPRADELRNKNLSESNQEMEMDQQYYDQEQDDYANENY